jgi:hypothetical protein
MGVKMKPIELIIWITLFIPMVILTQNQVSFNEFFLDKTMRIDYYHIGDATNESITIDKVYQYGIWAGSRIKLIDQFNNGKYYAKIYDKESKQLIYSKGFDSYFKEYQSSARAIAGIQRTYHETLLIPYPSKETLFIIERRDKENKLEEIFRYEIDPGSVDIIREHIIDRTVKTFNSHISGDPHANVDVAIIGEGYTVEEEDKFKADLKKFTQIFFNQEPYRAYKNKFNIYGIFKASEDTGVDEPRAGLFKKTILNATFNSLGSERYLMTEDNKTLRDIAAHVPYDALYIMVNHKRYGGGGIYNLYCTFTTANQFNEYLFIHEFGHSFAGLADEYYTSDVAYNDFYPRGVEPVEPNITALLNPDKLKWSDLLTQDIIIPTPWEKKGYDEMDYPWQEMRRGLNNKIAELKRTGAAQEKVNMAELEYSEKDKNHSMRVDQYLRNSIYWGKVGAFEGAGYSSQGLYRPMLDCIMFSKGHKQFCKVCERAIIKVIEHYTE